MEKLRFLNKKEIKQISEKVRKQWGCSLDLGYVYAENDKNKIFVINNKIKDIDLGKLRINSLGMYIIEAANEVRLGIEGSQLIGSKAAKNIIEITEEQARAWLKGEDLETKEKGLSGFIIIKHKNDFLGSGKYKDGIILNYVKKTRRI